MHILLGDAIKTADIDTAQEQLELFYELAPQLYPAKICTANLHSLIHLSRFVHSWGPLWCYSCFGFESMNGHLRKYCHGTRNVLSQLIHNVWMHQTLPILGKRLANSANPQMAALIQSSTGTISTSSSGTEIKGRISHKKLKESVATALHSASHVLTSALPNLAQMKFIGFIFCFMRWLNQKRCWFLASFMLSLNLVILFSMHALLL